jgi:hypothetical protein
LKKNFGGYFMKKLFGIAAMLMLVSTAVFAQTHFSLTGDFGTDFTGVGPSLNVELNLKPVDILVGTRFWFSKADDSYSIGLYTLSNGDIAGYDNSTTNSNYFKVYTGIAPKFKATEKWTITLPILLNYYQGDKKLAYDNSKVYSTSTPKETKYNGLQIDFGARAYYNFTAHWGLYFGGMVHVFILENDTTTNWKSSYSETYDEKTKYSDWFSGGLAILGVRYTF